MTRSDVLNALDADTRFVVASHVNPDGDSVGASLALARWLRGRGRAAQAVMPEGVPDQLRFLPDSVQTARGFPAGPADVTVVVVDTPEAGRIAAPEGYLESAGTLVNIDHHPGNAMFGDVNLVDTGASSASLLVYETLAEAGEIDAETANLLYVGVLTDTGAFRFGNTDSRTFRAAAALTQAGADAPWVARHVYGEQPLGRLRLLGMVLSSLESELEDRVAFMFLTEEMRAASRASGEEIEGLASYGHLLRDVEVTALLREQNGDVRVSLRSGGDVDVNEIAATFGGGGHRAAAGAILRGPLQDAKRRLLTAIAGALDRR